MRKCLLNKGIGGAYILQELKVSCSALIVFCIWGCQTSQVWVGGRLLEARRGQGWQGLERHFHGRAQSQLPGAYVTGAHPCKLDRLQGGLGYLTQSMINPRIWIKSVTPLREFYCNWCSKSRGRELSSELGRERRGLHFLNLKPEGWASSCPRIGKDWKVQAFIGDLQCLCLQSEELFTHGSSASWPYWDSQVCGFLCERQHAIFCASRSFCQKEFGQYSPPSVSYCAHQTWCGARSSSRLALESALPGCGAETPAMESPAHGHWAHEQARITKYSRCVETNHCCFATSLDSILSWTK